MEPAGTAQLRANPLFPPRPRRGKGSLVFDSIVAFGISLNLAALAWLLSPWAGLVLGISAVVGSTVIVIDRNQRRKVWRCGAIVVARVEPHVSLRADSNPATAAPLELALAMADPIGLSILALVGLALAPWWLLNKRSAKVLEEGRLKEVSVFGRSRNDLSRQYCWVVLDKNVAWLLESVAPRGLALEPIPEEQVDALRHAVRALW